MTDSSLSPSQEAAVQETMDSLFFYCRGFSKGETYNATIGPILRDLARRLLEPEHSQACRAEPNNYGLTGCSDDCPARHRDGA